MNECPPPVLRSDRARAPIAGSRSAWLDLVNQRSDVAVAEPVEIERSDVWSSKPRWLELRSVRDDQKHP